MKILLLIAHGSRKQAANEEVMRLAQRVEKLGVTAYDAVVTAFLEIAEPNILQGVEQCVELGAQTIVAVPYFLAAGNHVAVDIPRALDSARVRYPHITIEMSQYVGGDAAMAELVLACSELTN